MIAHIGIIQMNRILAGAAHIYSDWGLDVSATATHQKKGCVLKWGLHKLLHCLNVKAEPSLQQQFKASPRSRMCCHIQQDCCMQQGSMLLEQWASHSHANSTQIENPSPPNSHLRLVWCEICDFACLGGLEQLKNSSEIQTAETEESLANAGLRPPEPERKENARECSQNPRSRTGFICDLLQKCWCRRQHHILVTQEIV